MLTVAEKLRRVRLARGLSQAALAEAAGLGRSTVTQIEQGLRAKLQPDTFRQLARALNVDQAYFRSDDPKDYLRARLANLSADEATSVGTMQPHERWRWILADLELMWGDEWSVKEISGRLGLREATLQAMLEGAAEMSSPVNTALMKETGVPFTFVAGGRSIGTDEILSRYRSALEAAQHAGISPEQLEIAIRLMAAGRDATK